jgi:hypothetical protein
MKLFLLILFIHFTTLVSAQIYGFIKEKDSGEPLTGATIRLSDKIFFTDQQGYFSSNVKEADSLFVSMVGYNSLRLALKNKNYPILVFLSNGDNNLLEIVVSATPEIKNQPGLITLIAKEIFTIPSLAGEKDVIKAIQFMPGVQKGSEGSASLYVRGGRPDQNLIMLDNAILYNPNHFFGLFSVFNPNIIKNVDFYKSGFPTEYGGRLSSYLNVYQVEGDKNKMKGGINVGLLSSTINVEGPIRQNKSSFVVSARRTNLGAISLLINTPSNKQNYNFFDLNAKFSFQPKPNNKLQFSLYKGADKLSFRNNRIDPSGTIANGNDLEWSNFASIVNWFKINKNGSSLRSHVSYSSYSSGMKDQTTANSIIQRNFSFHSQVEDLAVKTVYQKPLFSKMEFLSGLNFNQRKFVPKEYSKMNTSQNQVDSGQQILHATEISAFSELNTKLSKTSVLNIGLRSMFYNSNKNWVYFEPRVSYSNKLSNSIFWSVSYDRTTQTLGLLQSSGYGLPTDLFITIGSPLKPQVADQLSLGLKMPHKKSFELSISTYFKKQQNLVNYRNGVWLFNLIDELGEFNWEQNIASGEGISYGIENMVKINKSKFNGWLSYTWQKSIVIFPELNNGKAFHPFGDRRHDLSLFATYKPHRKWTYSASFIFTTGLPISSPQGFYYVQNVGQNNFTGVNFYPGFNSERLPAYHRLDITASREIKKARVIHTWEFGLFNAYNRKNPFNQFVTSQTTREGTNLSLNYSYLLPIIPSITYALKFP